MAPTDLSFVPNFQANMTAMPNMTMSNMSVYDPCPVINTIYIADPSAHVFNNRVYIYPSHDRETNVTDTADGGSYDMYDYHVISMDAIGEGSGLVVDHGVGLSLDDVPWASRQAWAPDAAQGPDGRFYLYFPAKDDQDIFRIGVAHSDAPEGPFTAEPSYIPGSYSMDPASFVDDDGTPYLYFGGIWGGQLQRWVNGTYNASIPDEPEDQTVPALLPRVATLSTDMLTFNSSVEEVQILSPEGELLVASDHDRRFFEAPWMHKYNGVYYLSYSTGDTHFLVYATSDSPMGPFTYRGRILDPVRGWTTHHSIAEFQDRWYLFYADASLSGGVGYLRSTKVREILYDENGDISLAQPQPVVTEI